MRRDAPVLFFDFDNTLTEGDVLDTLIEAYSPDESWRDWEAAWTQGRIPARECLRLQIENLRVSRATLLEHLAGVRVDAAFAGIAAWARRHGVPVSIVSDSFQPFIEHILRCNGIDGVAIFANQLEFGEGDRLIPRFPFHDPAIARSANAKARHLAPYRGRREIVFAGDGHSDLDAALAADVVFAKSALAEDLAVRGAPFHEFDTLAPVLNFLEAM